MSGNTTVSARRNAPSGQMIRRTLFLMAVCGVLTFAVLAVRLWIIQIRDNEKYEELALAQQLRTVPASINRGTIYDRNMNILAVSTSVENVYVSPTELREYGEDKTVIANGLAEILGLDAGDILEKIENGSSWYVTIAKKLDRETADKVRAFKNENDARSVRLESDTKRCYPNSYLACHLIGFVGTDNYGLEGIEAMYDSILSGSAPVTQRLTNAYGSDVMFGQYENYHAGSEGKSIVLSVDETVQYFVEKHLKRAVEDYEIQNGAGAIAMDVNTGAILAMASIGNYDLNNFLIVSDEDNEIIASASTQEEAQELLRKAQEKQWRNKALSDTYEPGSTFKIITLSMALEEGKVTKDSSFYCGGSVNVPGRTQPVRCWKTEGHGSQNLTQAVQHSCNAAFVNIGLRVGAETFYDYCEAFGFLKLSEDADAQLTAKTGIDLAGESGSIWWSKNVFCSEKNLSQLAAASFGQTFTITPLQLITAVSACVNGGNLMKPYVVARVLDEDGNVLEEHKPEAVRKVLSESTSRTVCEILEKVVGDPNDGTGRNAAVAGYRIGGKTGTSEKVSLQTQTGKKEYIVSFIGFAPSDDPQIAILVFLDTPSDRSGIYISGGQMAAPVVGNIFADVLPYLGVMPSYENGSANEAVTPNLVGKSLDEAAAEIGNAGLKFKTVGTGSEVTAQLPSADTVIANGSEMLIYLSAEVPEEMVEIPELSGLTYEQARNRLALRGLFIRTTSTIKDNTEQYVSTQSIAAGDRLRYGQVVTVTIIDKDKSLLGVY